MSFDPNVPNTGQTLGQTKNPIRNNFNSLRSTLAQDHIDVNATGAGKHTVIHFPNAVSTSPATLLNEVALYSKDISGTPFLFYQGPNQMASAPDIQVTTGLSPQSFTPTYSVPSILISLFIVLAPAGMHILQIKLLFSLMWPFTSFPSFT